MRANSSCGILLLLLIVAVPAIGKNSQQKRVTVVYDDRATEITAANLPDTAADDLWLTTGDLKAATGFEVKPQGVCRQELCFPLPKERMKEFVRGHWEPRAESEPQARAHDSERKLAWFNLTAFAALVHQPVAHDDAVGMWYFGLRSDQQQRLASLRAPDFTLPDMAGKMHSLTDFRGKKVLLITWASW
jgi:hypothetical protein